MKIHWHSLLAGLVAVVTTTVSAVDPTKLPHNVATVVTVIGALIATFSKPAVQSQQE